MAVKRFYVRKTRAPRKHIFRGKLLGWGGGGGTLIFSYIRWLGSLFGVQNFEFQYFWGFLEKKMGGGGMKILGIFLNYI